MEELLRQNNFTTEEINDFIANAILIKSPKKHVLLREGDVVRHVYWATKGIFRAGFKDKKGTEHTRSFYSPETVPYVTSYGSYANQTPSLSFIDCIEEGELYSWHADYIKNLEDVSFKWLKFFRHQLDAVFILGQIKEWQFYTLPPEDRYLAFLEANSKIAFRIPQHFIASYIGVTPEAMSRIRKRIQNR
jgi:CRP-like cAMP-binding protein